LDLTNSTLFLKSLDENYKDIDGYDLSSIGKISSRTFIEDKKIDSGIKGVLYGLSREKKYIEESLNYAVLKVETNSIIHVQDNLYKFPNAYVCFIGNKNDSYKFIINNYNKNDYLLQKIIDKSDFYIKEYNLFFIEEYFVEYKDG